MPLYDNLDDLLSHLSRDIEESLIEIKTYFIDDEMVEAIDDVVYSVDFASNNPYQRRGESEGLKDRDNFKYESFVSPGGVEFHIRNVTKGNTDYNGSTKGEIDGIIVSGCGYTWEKSGFYQAEHNNEPIARDFYQATKERIDGRLGNKVTQELKRRGW